MNVFKHELKGDVPIGGAWIEHGHCEKHIEIVGGTGQGKTTLAEWLMLGILERNEAGLLLIDPTGDSCRKYLGWLADGMLERPCYLVDVDGPVLRYNPLAMDKEPKTLATGIAGLFEALHLIQSDLPAGQHRQMQRFVTATLRALIEADLTLADAQQWLFDPGYRAKYLGRIKHEETRQEWLREPSPAKIESTENWFSVFWEHDWLKAMFSDNGFDWAHAYCEQPAVLVNLRGLAGSIRYAKAIAAMFITGLLNHARTAPVKKLWYVVVDDATDYTPAHVAQLLTLGRHFDLFLVLIHHQPFHASLQGAVDVGCRTKFTFGEIPKKYRWKEPPPDNVRASRSRSWVDQASGFRYTISEPLSRPTPVEGPTSLPGFQCLHVFDERVIQVLTLEATPEAFADIETFKTKIYSNPWYGESKKEPRGKPSAPHTKPPRPPISQDRRGK